jgi:hypothetical protein
MLHALLAKLYTIMQSTHHDVNEMYSIYVATKVVSCPLSLLCLPLILLLFLGIIFIHVFIIPIIV